MEKIKNILNNPLYTLLFGGGGVLAIVIAILTFATSFFGSKEVSTIIIEADKLANMDNYEEALNKVQEGLEIYPNEKSLEEKVDEYKNIIEEHSKESALAEAAAFAESGDYISAMSLIKEILEIYGDDIDYQKIYDLYEELYNVQVKNTNIPIADTFVKEGNYLKAIEVIKEIIKEIGEDIELTDKLKEYEDAYVSNILAQADELLENEDYDSVDKLIKEAQTEFPNNTSLKEKSIKVDDLRPKYLLEVVTPYKKPYHYKDNTLFDMGGKTYSNGFTCMGYGDENMGNLTYFNLDGTYTEISFIVGIVDDADRTAKIIIYADDRPIKEVVLQSGALPIPVDGLQIEGCKKLMVAVYDGCSTAMYSGTYGIVEIIVTPKKN